MEKTTANFQRIVYDPVKLMKGWRWSTDHITVDDSIKPDYQIIRQHRHDGTMIFQLQILQEALINLANKESYWKKDTPDFSKIKDIKYTVTKLRMATVFGFGLSPVGSGLGQRDRVRIGIKCKYIY